MTCRHEKNDPSCSSHRDYREPEPYKAPVTYVTLPPKTPDAQNYVVERALQVDKHLIMRVKYPNCAACAFEGSKVMVFLNVAVIEALLWREIDPHFRDDGKPSFEPPTAPGYRAQTANMPVTKYKAPSPSARFPATHNGWQDAIEYARSKTS